MQREDKIYFAYFADFQNPTMLFFGHPKAFGLWKDFFEIPIESDRKNINLGDEPSFARGNVGILLKIIPEATGMKKISEHSFEWGLSNKECKIFADHFRGLAETPLDRGGGHYYLDCGTLDDVEVIASVGEYSVEFFQKRGADFWKNDQ